MTYTKTIIVRLTDKDHKYLEAAAKKNRMTISEVIRKMIGKKSGHK